MKLTGLDFLGISNHFNEDEIMVQRTTREFVDNEIIPIIEAGIIIFKILTSHFFQNIKIAIISIKTNSGNSIPAALSGLITNDINGIASIDIGPAKPPLAIPKKNTPIAANKYIFVSI